MHKKIIFVCKYNRFRSIIAEAFFNKLNKNKSMQAKSAGLIQGSSISGEVFALAKDLRLNIKKNPEIMTTELMKWADTIIIVANDVSPILFEDNRKEGKDVILWSIFDAQSDSSEEIKGIANKIEKKVTELVKKLSQD